MAAGAGAGAGARQAGRVLRSAPPPRGTRLRSRRGAGVLPLLAAALGGSAGLGGGGAILGGGATGPGGGLTVGPGGGGRPSLPLGHRLFVNQAFSNRRPQVPAPGPPGPVRRAVVPPRPGAR